MIGNNKKFTDRTEIIIGKMGLEKLKSANVIIFGVGGVGSFVVEGLTRAGVGNITIVDFDEIDITNINRQIQALHSTIGEKKVFTMAKRIKDINPELNLKVIDKMVDETNIDEILKDNYDYVIDAIDMVKSKILLIEKCKNKKIKIISSMGMGNKFDPTKIEIADIYKTEMCPLARVMRKELKQRYIEKLTVIYSKEKPIKPIEKLDEGILKRVNGTMSFVPSCGGLIIASKVVEDLINM